MTGSIKNTIWIIDQIAKSIIEPDEKPPDKSPPLMHLVLPDSIKR